MKILVAVNEWTRIFEFLKAICYWIGVHFLGDAACLVSDGCLKIIDG